MAAIRLCKFLTLSLVSSVALGLVVVGAGVVVVVVVVVVVF